jgi:protein TonB
MRLYTIVVSIVAHVVALIVLVIVPLAAMDALPSIRGVPDFIQVRAADLPEPPPPPRPRVTSSSSNDASRTRAPTSPPERIEPESITESGPRYDGPPGVPHGDPAGVPLLGSSAPAPMPPPTPTKLLRPGGDIRPPSKTRHVAPVYPAIALANRVQGLVILDAVIGENGRVRDVRVLRSVPLLDQAAVDAVRQWQFTPTLLNGQAVPVVMTVTVAFQLK